jgi:hypothetical protein
VKSTLKQFVSFIIIVELLISCTKPVMEQMDVKQDAFKAYIIPKGAHYSNQSTVHQLIIDEMQFKVQFDSSAVYTTISPENQYDINKLWGFTEGTDNHLNSARLGWGYNENKLKLYGYAYANGLRNSVEICSVELNTPIDCNIKISEGLYLFTVNGKTKSLPRSVIGTNTVGYQLYPYFGGDETAPHDIQILIKTLSPKLL